MKIFDVILNGESAKAFCKQTTEFKVDWILKNTKQKDIGLIMQFIDNPPKHNDCGCCCGGKKKSVSELEVFQETEVIENEMEDVENKDFIFEKKPHETKRNAKKLKPPKYGREN
jgi:hypothetical protein